MSNKPETPMRISRDVFLNQAFILTEDDLSKLHAALAEFGDKIRYEVGCSDGLNREFTSIDQLRTYENPPAKEIKSISVWARSTDRTCTALLKFDGSQHNNIWIDFEAPEEAAVRLNAAIEERLAGMRPWYARISKMDFVNVLFGLLGVFILALIVTVTILGSSGGGVPKDKATISPSALFAALIILSFPFAGGFILNRMQNRFFPMATFAIGQGAQRHDINEKARWIIVGVFGSLGVGLVSWLLSFIT